jgi:anti-anti-sigma factor
MHHLRNAIVVSSWIERAKMAIENASEDIVTVDLHPEPDMGTELATVASLVRLRGQCDVVVDFSNADIVTSASLSKLLQLRKLLTDCGHRLILCSLSADTESIFTVTALDQVFEFARDKSAALTAIRSAEPSASEVHGPA